MRFLQLASFNALANGARASTMVPPLAYSLGKAVLQFGGSLTKANITEIVGKLGARQFFGPVSAAELDKINKFRGQFDHANFVTVDLTERNMKATAAEELGAIDLPGLGGDAVFFEVLNSASTGTPTLTGLAGMTARQFKDVDKDGRVTASEQRYADKLIHKLIRFNLPNSGTRNVWVPNFRGALVKRMHFMYAGTDWTSGANGNLYRVDVRRNGLPVHDRVECLANRFTQQEYGLVPQSRTYTVDFIPDGNIWGALPTGGATIECTLEMTTAEAPTVFVEVLDIPNNL